MLQVLIVSHFYDNNNVVVINEKFIGNIKAIVINLFN